MGLQADVTRRSDTGHLVLKGIGILTAPLLPALVFYVMTHPQALVRFRLRTALFVKRHAQARADTWSTIAASAATSYHKATL